MLLQEPAESPYDIRFQLLGFPIRVAWTFWLGTLVFGYGLVDFFDRNLGPESPGRLILLLLWAAAVFLSILIHELGHAIAFRQFGVNSSIVLYHFGGLAIPTSSFVPGRGFARLSERQDLWIAAAGPLFQLVSAALVIGLLKGTGHEVFAFALMPAGLDRVPGMLEGDPLSNPMLLSLATFYIWPSVVWALLNLIPVWPLDGGRITRSLVVMGGGNIEQALWISLIAAGAMALYGFREQQLFMGILFASLAIGNYQAIQGGMRPRF